ncbi:Trace amine-associated receptor 1 [Dissostichus eleginoides]|uniref:Trace amine-associated receptor 1 n=1 Tax=Dissostichus eleginoides TaxID=100907 RepID=A0AAD9CNG6_DISEL|nr:Trace amine-associated receptor 1 [Dissostichus eleginoides]
MRSLVIMAAVARFQSLQTPTNGLVVCLAVVDFLVGKLMMPLSLVRSIDSGHFGCCFCRANFLLMSPSSAPFFNLSLMVLDRYIAVCNPLHYPARMSARCVAYCCCSAGSCLWSSPPFASTST